MRVAESWDGDVASGILVRFYFVPAIGHGIRDYDLPDGGEFVQFYFVVAFLEYAQEAFGLLPDPAALLEIGYVEIFQQLHVITENLWEDFEAVLM